jgi:eukaryotic-like serine/threonine-protein kinase
MQFNRWQKIERIFSEAVVLSPAQRPDYLAEKCGDDFELREEISSMLAQDSNEEFMSEPVFNLGAQLLDAEDLLQECEFGSYQLQRLLGRGGMGAVYLAQDTRLERPVAIKVLPKSAIENADDVARFRQEARAVSGISHPNITHIYEFGKANNRWYLAMEYVKGKTLRELLKTDPPDESAIIDIARQTAAALSATHKRGIIHQDIKPENIIVADNGTVKILDFGLAKPDMQATEDEEKDNSLTENLSELIIGTAAYMSPEKISGKAIDSRTDLWSFGVVLFEMLTGKRPFAGITADDWKAAILSGDIRLDECPKNFRPIVSKLLQKNPANRYQSIEDVIAAITSLEKSKSDINSSSGIESYFQKHSILIIGGLLVLLLGLSGAGFQSFNEPSTFSSASSPINSIAVLPFQNENGTEDNDYLSEGLTESLINKLSRLSKLSVISGNSARRYKGKPVDAKIIGRELSVQAVLLGRFVEQKDEISINLDLIETQTGRRIWNKHYKYQNTDLVIMQKEIVQDVISILKPRLSVIDERVIRKNYTENVEAYRLYLKGRFYWNKRTAKDLQKSIEYYEQAVALDANFALAYAGLADTYLLMSGYAASSPHDSFPKAKMAAKKALEIDDTLAEAHNALSYALFNYDWNAAEAEKEIKLAIELNPNYATARQWYGNAILLATGRFEEAIAELKHAQELDPLSLIINADLGTTLLFARRVDEAIEQFEKTIEMDENFSYAHAFLCRAYAMKNNFPAAIAECRKAESLSNDPRPLVYLALIYAKQGQKENSLKLLNQLKNTAKQKYVTPYYFALVYAGLGEKDRAFEQLNQALLQREGRMTLIKVDPLMDELRQDSRFSDLLRLVNLENK